MIPRDVLQAFGLQGEAYHLAGGQGTSWRCGDHVLKPHEASYEGISLMVNQIQSDEFRISMHEKTLAGNFTYQGWGCTRFVPGTEVTGRITEKYHIAQKLHDVLGKIELPPGWKPSDSPWSRAHAIVWGEMELPTDIHPEIYQIVQSIIKRLEQSPPVKGDADRQGVSQNQIIHGDLSGNILFHESLSPAVIDFSLDYRPREYAEAILIADSISWEGGGEEAYALLPADSEQILLRACLFRLLTKALLKPWDLESFLTRSRGYRDIIRQIAN